MLHDKIVHILSFFTFYNHNQHESLGCHSDSVLSTLIDNFIFIMSDYIRDEKVDIKKK